MGAAIHSVSRDLFDAVLFDLDGVLTDTAKIHAACWKQTFDEFLEQRAQKTGEPFRPFDQTDYRDYVDGEPRHNGVRNFLDSRNIELPEGEPDDPPDKETVYGLANHKTDLFDQILEKGDLEVFAGSVAWTRQLRRMGIKTAVVSASKHCRAILEIAGIADLFDARVDGQLAEELQLPGKPAPDTYLQAAKMLGVKPKRAVVVEDALSGVEAGCKGGFGLVIGVDRQGAARALREHGADVVVGALEEMLA